MDIDTDFLDSLKVTKETVENNWGDFNLELFCATDIERERVIKIISKKYGSISNWVQAIENFFDSNCLTNVQLGNICINIYILRKYMYTGKIIYYTKDMN